MTILKLGNVHLINKAQSVIFPLDNETKTNIEDLKHTLLSLKQSAGLSANQLGINKQIIVYRVPFERVNDCEEYFTDIRVLINPCIDNVSNELSQNWEGCLSVPNIKLVTQRYSSIHVSGFDENQVLQEINAKGFLSFCLQHEIDHLNGITFFERNDNKKMITLKDELNTGVFMNSNVNKLSMGNF